MTKIVRKVNRVQHNQCAFWLNGDGEVRGWYEDVNTLPGDRAEQEVAYSDGGWTANEVDAAECGTTLSALRYELREDGE